MQNPEQDPEIQFFLDEWVKGQRCLAMGIGADETVTEEMDYSRYENAEGLFITLPPEIQEGLLKEAWTKFLSQIKADEISALEDYQPTYKIKSTLYLILDEDAIIKRAEDTPEDEPPTTSRWSRLLTKIKNLF